MKLRLRCVSYKLLSLFCIIVPVKGVLKTDTACFIALRLRDFASHDPGGPHFLMLLFVGGVRLPVPIQYSLVV